MSNKIKPENEEQLISSLKDVVAIIKTRENPEELNQYRRIFKKAVPLTMRSYVAAYFIKEAGIILNTGKGVKKDVTHRIINQGFKPSTGHSARPRVVLPDEESTSIFIGIGRKRGIFPKDIITLLIQGADIARDHIGGIRILDNYSFVQVMQDEADGIITKLNNSYYRGKTLTVSHSRKAPDETNIQENQDTIENQETEITSKDVSADSDTNFVEYEEEISSDMIHEEESVQ